MSEKRRDTGENLSDHVNLQSMEDFEDFFNVILPQSSRILFGGERNIERATDFMDLIGNPQEAYKTIHIAGTSGKGSVCVYLTELLTSFGFKTGTHLSPHVDDVRERAMINGGIPSEETFLKTANDLISPIMHFAKTNERPTYFLAMNALAFSLFADEKVDYAVIETGIGGTYDTTNVIKRADKLAVITRLGIDHTNLLGNTMEEIASHKAGISPENGELMFLKSKDSVNKVIEDAVRSRDSLPIQISGHVANVRREKTKVIFDYDSPSLQIKDIELKTPALYQAENASLSIAILEKLAQRDGWELDTELIKKTLSEAVIPGRMEVHTINEKPVIFDGAHSTQKMSGLVESIKALDLPAKPIWVLAFKNTRELGEIIDIISDFNDGIVATKFSGGGSDFLAKRAVPIEDLVLEAEKCRVKVLGKNEDPKIALKQALEFASNNQLVIVSGSVYMLGEAKQLLN